ncbi:MAG: ATP synthase F0 subunit B [Nitrospiraceae bacterium]|nr:ATP synthase F0 subunit B [Nitrospiraceae bacterium]
MKQMLTGKPETGYRKLHTMLFVLCSLLFASVVYAAGGEAGAEHEPSLFQAYLWPVVNFLVLIGLVIYVVKKADLGGYFRKRTELIEQTLREAKEAKVLAEKALAEVDERLRVKDKEIDEIITYARQSGENEKTRLIAEGETMKEKIIEQTKNNIEYEVKRAKELIKEEAVLVAMELAEKKLKEKMTKEEQIKLLEESLAKIEGKQ